MAEQLSRDDYLKFSRDVALALSQLTTMQKMQVEALTTMATKLTETKAEVRKLRKDIRALSEADRCRYVTPLDKLVAAYPKRRPIQE